MNIFHKKEQAIADAIDAIRSGRDSFDNDEGAEIPRLESTDPVTVICVDCERRTVMTSAEADAIEACPYCEGTTGIVKVYDQLQIS